MNAIARAQLRINVATTVAPVTVPEKTDTVPAKEPSKAVFRRDGAPISTSKMVAVPTGKGGTRKVRSYTMNSRGAALLVMGFTGPEALHWKQKFLDAFDHLLERENDNHKAFLHGMKKSPGLTFEQAQKRIANKALKARRASMKLHCL